MTNDYDIGDYFLAKVNYHRTDDLREDCAPNGSLVHIKYAWTIEPDEKFFGDTAFMVAESVRWLPSRDLEIIKKISSAEFMEAFESRFITKNKER